MLIPPARCVRPAPVLDPTLRFGCRQRGWRTLILIAALLLLAFALGGCSRVQIAYNTADFAIELYARRYLSLDARQVAAWRPVLAIALDEHRDEEIPAIVALLTQAANDVRGALSEAKVAAWLDQFEPLYQRHARLFAATAAPLLAALTEAQIDALEAKFLEQARDDATDNSPASLAKRQRKRIERHIENIQWATGTLNPAQIELVQTEIAAFPDTATSWFAYRERQRQALIALLRQGADMEQVRSFLNRWLAKFDGLPVDLVEARTQMRSGLVQLFVKLDASLSDVQRQHFEQRLTTLAEDFQSLQRRRPTQAPGV